MSIKTWKPRGRCKKDTQTSCEISRSVTLRCVEWWCNVYVSLYVLLEYCVVVVARARAFVLWQLCCLFCVVQVCCTFLCVCRFCDVLFGVSVCILKKSTRHSCMCCLFLGVLSYSCESGSLGLLRGLWGCLRWLFFVDTEPRHPLLKLQPTKEESKRVVP